jgi:hypothetical protein
MGSHADDRYDDGVAPPVVRTSRIEEGDMAPPIALPSHDGTVWRLEAQRGRRVLMIYHRHLG